MYKQNHPIKLFVSLGLLMFISCSIPEKNNESLESGKWYSYDVSDSTLAGSMKKIDDAINVELGKRMIGYSKTDSDQLLLRVFRFESMDSTHKLVLIRKDIKGIVSAKLVIFSLHIDSLRRNLNINIDSSVLVQPLLIRENFMDGLLSLDVLNLPDYAEITTYDIPTDGHSYKVHYFQSDTSREFNYPSPDANLGIPSARRMMTIATFIESEMGFNGFGYLKYYEQFRPEDNIRNQREITGEAVNAKMGAMVISSNDKKGYYLSGIDSWEKSRTGRLVKVKGEVWIEEKKYSSDELSQEIQGVVRTILNPRVKWIN